MSYATTPDRMMDVRSMRKPDKHPAIFAAFDALDTGDGFVLVNDHDPRHLHDEFEVEYPNGYSWEYLSEQPRNWQIRITKLASTSLPRVLVQPGSLPVETDAVGAIWKLEQRERDLDSNIINLQPETAIEAYDGPDIDVLVYVLAGDGVLTTERGEVTLTEGALAILPRRSRRGFTAGQNGLRYLTVHQKRKALLLEPMAARG